MKRGKTEVETLKLNGWGVGDILEGSESSNTSRIKITAIGEEVFCCRWDYKCRGIYSQETGNTTLSCREWRKVNTVNKPVAHNDFDTMVENIESMVSDVKTGKYHVGIESNEDRSARLMKENHIEDDLQCKFFESDIHLLQKIDSYLTVISDEERKHVDNMMGKFNKYGKNMKISEDEHFTLLDLSIRLEKSTIEGRKRK